MNILKLCVAVVVGFILGACFYHPLAVKAQADRAPVIVVEVGPGNGAPLPTDARVVGFSCIGNGKCYMAVQRIAQ